MAERSELGDQLLAAIQEPRRAVAEAILRNAINRGELPEDLHPDVAIDLIAAPLALRVLILGETTDNYLAALVSAVEAALHSARRPRGRKSQRDKQ